MRVRKLPALKPMGCTRLEVQGKNTARYVLPGGVLIRISTGLIKINTGQYPDVGVPPRVWLPGWSGELLQGSHTQPVGPMRSSTMRDQGLRYRDLGLSFPRGGGTHHDAGGYRRSRTGRS